MSILIANHEIPVTSATLVGEIPDPYHHNTFSSGPYPGLKWRIEIDSITHTGSFDSYAKFYCDSLRLPVARWIDIAPRKITSQELRDELDIIRVFSYFGSHDQLPDSTLHFLTAQENEIKIRWEGICDPYWEEPLSKNVPFVIEANLQVMIKVGGSGFDTEQSFFARLNSHIDASDFLAEPIASWGSYRDGVSSQSVDFRPRSL